jgi:hypothetical protein
MNGPEIIRQYILAMKGVDIGGIQEPVTHRDKELYSRALSIAMHWYFTRS